ncbi:unnamed protein product, partial [uncultured virus]
VLLLLLFDSESDDENSRNVAVLL